MALIKSSGRSVISDSGDVQIQLAVDAEAADAAQPIAIGVVELFVEQRPGLFQLRRIAGTQPLINSQQRLFVAAGGVFLQAVEDQRHFRLRGITSTECRPEVQISSARFLVILCPASTMTSPALSLLCG